jgi:hypothetical protein
MKYTEWIVQREAEEKEKEPKAEAPKEYSVTCARCGRHMGWSKKPGEKGICSHCYGKQDLALSPGAGNR